MEGYPKRKRGDPTWSKARDDAYAQKERPGGEPYRLCTLHNLRDAARRDETIAIVCAVNPSVSLTAASSPYTGEPLGVVRCHALYTREAKGWRAADLLPLTQGGQWGAGDYFFSRRKRRARPGLTVCSARAMSMASSGTSRVTVAPAAV